MSETDESAVCPGTSEKSKEQPKLSPPHDLPLNLDLYNYDSPDAQSCPYVLTSPRSLEACSRVGVKPVDLLQKTLEEFSTQVEQGKPVEEVCKLYDENETHRIILLKKCQAERDFIIWRTSPKPRSQSLSPCRRHKTNNPKDSFHVCSSIHSDSINVRKSEDDLLSISYDGRQSRLSSRRSRSTSVKNRNPRPVSWSTPASPHFRGSSNLFVRITSPVVCAKLQSFPRNKMKLPPKEMKILEVILQKFEKKEEEEHRRARAARIWDREKEERVKRKEEAELERWKNLALKQRRSCSEERTIDSSDDSSRSAVNQSCSGLLLSPRDERDRADFVQKRRSFKVAKNQSRESSESKSSICGRLSRYDADQRLKAIRVRESQVEKRRQDIISQRNDDLKRSAEELRVKIKQVKMNQKELDKSLEQWQDQVIGYQDACNTRASEKVAELCEQRRLKVKQERVSRQVEHKKKMKRLEAEEYAKLQEMMEKLRSKDERSKAFVQEKHSTIEQSRQLALAASDLRDLIRQKLDKDLFLKRSQQAVLDSRLQQLEPRVSVPKEKEPNGEDL